MVLAGKKRSPHFEKLVKLLRTGQLFNIICMENEFGKKKIFYLAVFFLTTFS